MSKKQIAVLILGCLFLIAGFFVLIRMTTTDDVFDLSGLFRSSAEISESTEGIEPEAAEPTAEGNDGETDGAAFDRMLESMAAAAPPWVYIVMFGVIVLLVRYALTSYEVRSARKSKELRERRSEHETDGD
jgi:hypothetical protein